MKILPLDGSWSLRDVPAEFSALPATVPGCVHLDLMAAGRIPEPFHRDHERHLQWIGERAWIFSRTFEVDADVLDSPQVWLRCEGLDTLATIRLNGQPVACTENMFRIHEFEVRPCLHAGGNHLEIEFQPTAAYIQEKLGTRTGVYSSQVLDYPPATQGYIRKMACAYGWDWGPRFVTCGIWRSISLVLPGEGRIQSVQVRQAHRASGSGRVDLDLTVQAEGAAGGTSRLRIAFEGRTVASSEGILEFGRATHVVHLADSNLWWPNGLGAQPLYEVEVELVGASGAVADRWARRIGLRTLELRRRPDAWGESFEFVCNGRAFFAKGANWIPVTPFPADPQREMTTHLLRSAAAVHMNMLRVWGGGIYESDAFYDLCDELGICVWQDMALANNHLPLHDAAFLDEVAAEFSDQIRRLRHHACLALWCGNNEMEMGGIGEPPCEGRMPLPDYAALFDQRLPRLLRELDPERTFWPSSPHAPVGDRMDYNSAASGDAHIWDVWHHAQPFSFYRMCQHRFFSEFGLQSFPAWRTIESFTEPADRDPDAPIMRFHQRHERGNELIRTYLRAGLGLPQDFASLVWLSQIQQAEAMRALIEHARRQRPRCMGTLFWQLNDCWPVVSWSSIDGLGRWKALHHACRQLYAPLALSAVCDAAGQVAVHLANDTAETAVGRLGWRWETAAGQPHDEGLLDRVVAPDSSACLARLVRPGELAPEQGLLWLTWHDEAGACLAETLWFPEPAQNLALRAAHPEVAVTPLGGRRFALTVRVDVPVLWLMLDTEGLEVRWEDNFRHVHPARPWMVEAEAPAGVDATQLRRALVLRDYATLRGQSKSGGA